MTKISNLSPPDSFFKLKIYQNPFLDSAEGAYDASPDPVVGWGGGYPVPIPLPTRRLKLGASVLRPSQHKILATPVVHVSTGRGVQRHTRRRKILSLTEILWGGQK